MSTPTSRGASQSQLPSLILRRGVTGPRRRKNSLHHHCQVFQFVHQHGHGASRHFDAACRIERGLGRHPIATTHQKHLEQFGGLVRVDHPPLEQIVPQSCQFGRREPVFIVHCLCDHSFLVRHGRHHLRLRPTTSLPY